MKKVNYLFENNVLSIKNINFFINKIPNNIVISGKKDLRFNILLKTLYNIKTTEGNPYSFIKKSMDKGVMRVGLKNFSLGGKKIKMASLISSNNAKTQFFQDLNKIINNNTNSSAKTTFTKLFLAELQNLNKNVGAMYDLKENNYIAARQSKHLVKKIYKSKLQKKIKVTKNDPKFKKKFAIYI